MVCVWGGGGGGGGEPGVELTRAPKRPPEIVLRSFRAVGPGTAQKIECQSNSPNVSI